jgi:hypothetical protein
MDRISPQDREAIVREAVAMRDAILAGAPRKLWLWKNFVDGRREYWAFDNPYPINLTDGDPQTLGEPCGYALFKPSRQGRTDVSEEQVLRAVARVWGVSESHQQLMKFYGVSTLQQLVDAQARHVEKLQAKLPATPSLAPQRVREG